MHGTKHETYESWLKIYENSIYCNSVLNKGPLLLLSSGINGNLPPSSFLTTKVYKSNVGLEILTIQSSGDKDQMQNINFPLQYIAGLRSSSNQYTYTYRQIVDHTRY